MYVCVCMWNGKRVGESSQVQGWSVELTVEGWSRGAARQRLYTHGAAFRLRASAEGVKLISDDYRSRLYPLPLTAYLTPAYHPNIPNSPNKHRND